MPALARLAALAALAFLPGAFLPGQAIAQPADAAAGQGDFGPPVLSIPIDCRLGETCFVQNYVDIDPGPGVRDYACGAAAYDGHKGTDFRIRSSAEANVGVPVLASALGRVRGVREGMPDRLIRSFGSRDLAARAIGGRDCGNGVVIDHGGGWETQYCHLRQGSVRVATGEAVERGTVLGYVGFSGMADFAHVHLSVRHQGQIIDPFMGASPGAACLADPERAKGLWAAEAAAALAYRSPDLLALGFAAAPLKLDALEADHHVVEPGRTADALVGYARLINMRKGDRVRIRLDGPAGFAYDETAAAIDADKAQWLAFGGRRRKAETWPPGDYRLTIEVIRASSPVLSRSHLLTMR